MKSLFGRKSQNNKVQDEPTSGPASEEAKAEARKLMDAPMTPDDSSLGSGMGSRVGRNSQNSMDGSGSAGKLRKRNTSTGSQTYASTGSNSSLSITSFDVLNKLGEGGFGTVLLVRKKDTGKLYALKVLVKKNMKIEDGQRAIQESKAMQELTHPFVVTLHFAFQDPLHIYFCLEFVSRGDLYEQIAKRKFPEDWCKVYIAEVALALEHCHNHKFVYRDLKPENVLIGNDGHMKLADFGLAKKIENGGRLQSLVGSYHSIAPEVFMERDYGFSVDFWALGILFCEMITNDAPIVHVGQENFKDLLTHYFNGTHLAMTRLQRRFSPKALSLVVGLLTVPTAERLGSSPEGAERLHQHEFFEGLDWEALLRKEIPAPLASEQAEVDELAPYLKGLEDNKRMSQQERDEAEKAKQAIDAVLDDGFEDFVNNMDGEQDQEQRDLAWSAMLCEATKNRDLSKLRELQAAGAPIDQGDYNQSTAIHLAASEGLLDVANFLVVEAMADVNVVDKFGNTPLDLAVKGKHEAMVEFLRANGGISNNAGVENVDWASLLCEAAKASDIAKLKEHIANGAPVNKGDYDDRTAIHLAASEGLTDVVKFLILEAKADPNPVDRWGFSPLDDAMRQKHVEVVEFLTDNGAKSMLRNKNRSMDLCDAAQKGNVTALRVLMVQGVDVNQADYDKRTAMHLAASEGLEHVLRFLVHEAKAEVNPVDRWGNTPLDDAIRQRHDDVMDFLMGVGGEEGSAMAVGVASDKKKATLVEMAEWAAGNDPAAVRLGKASNGGDKLLGAKVVFVGLTDQEMNGMTGFVTECCPGERYIVQLEYVMPSRPSQKRIKIKYKNIREHDSLLNEYGLAISKKSSAVAETRSVPFGRQGSDLGSNNSPKRKQTLGERLNLTVPQPANPFECPLTKTVFKDPVVALDGNTYERQAIVEWWKTCGTKDEIMKATATAPGGGEEEPKPEVQTKTIFLSPITGDVLESDNLVPNNLAVASRIHHLEEIQKLKTASGQFAEVKQLEQKLAQQKLRTEAARSTADMSAASTLELQRTLTDKLTKLAESQHAAEQAEAQQSKEKVMRIEMGSDGTLIYREVDAEEDE